MLDQNLPTYRLRPSTEDPLLTVVYFAHRGADPSAAYLLRRPAPAQAPNCYALGLFDAHLSSVLYAELSLRPQAAAATANGPASSPVAAPPMTLPASSTLFLPDSFSILLYNPDQSVVVRRHPGSWGKSDWWEFELPERSFRLPSASRIDQDLDPGRIADLDPQVVFRWKRDGRLSRDMTCYLSGRRAGGSRSKEPDITVAMFRACKHGGTVTIYEPNMARVPVEDLKGLEFCLILSANLIRDLHLMPGPDPFNLLGGAAASTSVAAASTTPTGTQEEDDGAARERERERRKLRERERRDKEEQDRIKKMLKQEEESNRLRREAAIEEETERLRRQYGVQAPATGSEAKPRPKSPPPGSSQRRTSSGGRRPSELEGESPPLPSRRTSFFFHRREKRS